MVHDAERNLLCRLRWDDFGFSRRDPTVNLNKIIKFIFPSRFISIPHRLTTVIPTYANQRHETTTLARVVAEATRTMEVDVVEWTHFYFFDFAAGIIAHGPVEQMVCWSQRNEATMELEEFLSIR